MAQRRQQQFCKLPGNPRRFESYTLLQFQGDVGIVAERHLAKVQAPFRLRYVAPILRGLMTDLMFFALVVFGILAVLGDSITTMIGLGANKGFTEGNPIAAWMFKKIGQSLSCWLGGVTYVFTALGFYAVNHAAGAVFAGSVAAAETYFTIKNYLLLKKLGIKL